jgi:enhancing lycopene biosynthesis protein 2
VAEALGAKHQCCQPTEYCVDRQHRVYTTPAYMVGTHISQIFDGAENMVAAFEADLK